MNGRELTSADVKFSIDYGGRYGEFKDLKLPSPSFKFQFEGLDRVDTPDRHTAVVRFLDGFVPFLNYSATHEMPIFAREVFDEDGHFQNRVAGTGPWQWDAASSQAGSRMVWKRHPEYFEPGRPYIDEVRTTCAYVEPCPWRWTATR